MCLQDNPPTFRDRLCNNNITLYYIALKWRWTSVLQFAFRIIEFWLQVSNHSYKSCILLKIWHHMACESGFGLWLHSSLFCVNIKNAVGLGQEAGGTVEPAAAVRGSDCLCPGFVLHITQSWLRYRLFSLKHFTVWGCNSDINILDFRAGRGGAGGQ